MDISRTLLWALLLMGALSAHGQIFSSEEHPPVIIELYTSEGCSSCPPAERWLNRFAQDPLLWKGLIPMAWHVDYWDYIGWPDRYAKPYHGARQRRYQRETPLRSVYTPGVIVNGEAWRGWRRGGLPRQNQRETIGMLRVDLQGEHFKATLSPLADTPGSGDFVLSMAVLGFGLTTEVRRGENSGRLLSHDFVVLAWRRVGVGQTVWSGELPDEDQRRDETTRLAVVFWLERPDSPVPLQAVGGWLSPEQ